MTLLPTLFFWGSWHSRATKLLIFNYLPTPEVHIARCLKKDFNMLFLSVISENSLSVGVVMTHSLTAEPGVVC